MTVGFLGHDERLRYKKIHYDMHGVAWVDDPFEVSLGSIDCQTTGRNIGNFLFRGFIIQSVLLALLKPRAAHAEGFVAHARAGGVRKRSERTSRVRVQRNLQGAVPPKATDFPKPDLQSCYQRRRGSTLDPYIYYAGDGRHSRRRPRQVGQRQ
jgi:hypothetical protein